MDRGPLSEIWSFVSCDLLAAHRAESKIRRDTRNVKDEAKEDDKRIGARLEAVRRYYDGDLARRRTIEEKAKMSLIGITTSTSIVFAGLNLVSGNAVVGMEPVSLRATYGFLLCLAMLYYMFGALSSLKALEVGEVFGLSLEDESRSCEDVQVRVLVSALERNQNLTRIRANYAYASMACLRNGTILLLVFIVFSFFVAVFRGGPPSSDGCVPGDRLWRVVETGASQGAGGESLLLENSLRHKTAASMTQASSPDYPILTSSPQGTAPHAGGRALEIHTRYCPHGQTRVA